MPTNQSSYFQRNGHLDGDAASFGAIYNAGMMLDEQLDEEMHSKILDVSNILIEAFSSFLQTPCATSQLRTTTNTRPLLRRYVCIRNVVPQYSYTC